MVCDHVYLVATNWAIFLCCSLAYLGPFWWGVSTLDLISGDTTATLGRGINYDWVVFSGTDTPEESDALILLAESQIPIVDDEGLWLVMRVCGNLCTALALLNLILGCGNSFRVMMISSTFISALAIATLIMNAYTDEYEFQSNSCEALGPLCESSPIGWKSSGASITAYYNGPLFTVFTVLLSPISSCLASRASNTYKGN